jgi:small nuclear ribonucleoprotein
MSGRPLDVLEASLDEVVTVHLKDGRAFRGELAGYDQHMNVVLEPGLEADPVDLDVEAVEDTTIIRGDNVVTITA